VSYAQEKEERSFFVNVTMDGFACVRSCGTLHGDLFRFRGAIPRPLTGATAHGCQEAQDGKTAA
jgi:hypothetical protein